MEKDTKDTGAQDLAKALNDLAASQKAIADGQKAQTEALTELGSRIEKLETKGVITQSTEQALDTQVKVATGRVEGAKSEAEKSAAVTELETKLAERDAELKSIRENESFRKSGWSLSDTKDKLEGIANAGRTKMLDIFGGLHSKAEDAKGWQKEFPDRTPDDVIINGAHEMTVLTGKVAGTGVPIQVSTLQAMPNPDDSVLREAQEANDLVFLWKLLRGAKGLDASLERCPYMPRLRKATAHLAKALNSTTMANWIPTGFSAKVFERYELQRNLTKLLEAIQMPQNPYDAYVGGARPSIRATSSLSTTSDPENATRITSSVIQPLKTPLALHGFAIRIPFDKDAEEDSLPALLPRITLDIATAWRYYEEDIYLNSSSALNHIDVDVTGATHHLKTVDGMRPLAIANGYTSPLASAQDAEGMISTCLSAMGIFSGNPSDLVCVIGPKVRAKLLTMKTNAGYPVIIGSATLAPLPSGMTLGEIPSIAGSPAVVVEAARENLNASGFYDGTTTSKGNILWFNRRGPIVGYRNLAGETMTTLEPATLQTDLVYYVRREFEDLLPIASNHWVHVGTGLSF